MKAVLITLGIIGGLLLLVGACTMGSYNGMVSADNEIDRTLGNVQSAYQQRLDTLPKFAQTAKLSTQFQVELQERYVESRNAVQEAASTGDPNQLEQTANSEFAALRSFLTVQVEAVPQADTSQLTELNAQIESVERVIKHERDAYNTAVKAKNDKVKHFPGNIVAGQFGFEPSTSFAASEEAQESPDLDLGLD